MKFTKLHKILIAIVAVLGVAIYACNEFDYVDQPENVYLNDDVTILAKLKIDASTNYTVSLVFGMYAPKALDLANNATLTFSTLNIAEVLGADYPGQAIDIKNEILTPCSTETCTDPSDVTWSEAFYNNYGSGGNAELGIEGDMEWVVWKSNIQTYISDKLQGDVAHNMSIYADVNISFNAGPNELECYLGYGYVSKEKGFNSSDEHISGSVWKHFVVEEYVAPTFPSLEMIQSAYRFGDIFGMEFSADASALEGETDIYLCGKAVYDGGQTVVVSEALDANRMNPFTRKLPNGDERKLFEKYIYPPYFFNLPSETKIEEITLWFINADGSKVADTCVVSGLPFDLEQTPGSIHDVEEPEVPEDGGEEVPEEGGEETPEEGGDAPVEE